MPKVTWDDATQRFQMEGYEGRFEQVDRYTVAFERATEHQHPVGLFRGLPDDSCQCPHWGVVLNGRLEYHYSDGSTEVFETGDAYYVRPGHVPEVSAGTQVIEFSPTEELMKTVEVVTRNVEAGVLA